jgi:hypothetical protein
MQRITAGELSQKAMSDTTNYNLLELGHAICEGIPKELIECIGIYKNIIDEEEFCIVRQKATDPLITPLLRYKYFGYPYLPKPRPDQNVFLYNKPKDSIVKRLWTLPSDARMAQLASTNSPVPKEYELMQAWSIAFFKGTFWEFIRYQHQIDMPSEHEYFLQHREELIKAGCKIPDSNFSEPFDFSKIAIEKIIDTQAAVVS